MNKSGFVFYRTGIWRVIFMNDQTLQVYIGMGSYFHGCFYDHSPFDDVAPQYCSANKAIHKNNITPLDGYFLLVCTIWNKNKNSQISYLRVKNV